MAKKIFIIPILVSVLLLAACTPDGDAYEDSDTTGNYFWVSIDPKSGTFTVDGATISGLPSTDVTFVNESISGSDTSSDVFITEFDLEFVRPENCSKTECPPLKKITAIPLFQEVLRSSSASVAGVPMALPSTYEEFMLNSTGTTMVAYKVIATYHGETEFGYSVKTKSEFALLLQK